MFAVIVPLRRQKQDEAFRLTLIHLRYLNQGVPGVKELFVLYNINIATVKHLYVLSVSF